MILFNVSRRFLANEALTSDVRLGRREHPPYTSSPFLNTNKGRMRINSWNELGCHNRQTELFDVVDIENKPPLHVKLIIFKNKNEASLGFVRSF